MSYIFSNSAEGDIRIQRSTVAIKGTYLEMLGEMEEDAITVSDLTDRAGINRKTFYLHYKNKEALRDEIADDMILTLDEKFTGDLESDILVLYEFLDTDDRGLQKLFTDVQYREFRDRMYDGIFRHGAFSDWVQKSRDPELTVGYLCSVIGIFNRYMEQNPAKKNLKKLARNASHLVSCGISGGDCVSAYLNFGYQCCEKICKAA